MFQFEGEQCSWKNNYNDYCKLYILLEKILLTHNYILIYTSGHEVVNGLHILIEIKWSPLGHHKSQFDININHLFPLKTFCLLSTNPSRNPYCRKSPTFTTQKNTIHQVNNIKKVCPRQLLISFQDPELISCYSFDSIY